MSTFLFSIFFTILFPFVKLDILQPPPPPPPLTSTITPAPTAIRYDHGASLESVMLECWTKPTGLFVYTDETCHLAWKYTLLHAKIKKIASIEDIPLETVGVLKSRHQTGEIQLDLDSGFKAIFRSCSFDNYRWESELVAYEIDRLLHLHRTPPVVLRHVEWAELSDTDLDVEQETKLASVHKACHAQRLITSGAMIGYTSHDLKLITTGILSDWMGGELFSVTAPTQRLLEFVKLSIALLMFDIPEKLLQEGAHELFVPKIVDGKAARITGNYFYVYVENQRAAFSDTSFDVHYPAVPACDRIKKKKTFQCNMNWPNTTGVARAKQRTAMRSLLMSFLSSACLFPRGIAERLLHYGSTDKSQALSLEHELRAALHSQDVHNIQPLAGVSTRLHAIFSVLVGCVKEHKATGVLIEEAIYDFVKEPPKIHYDPAGRKFEYNAKSGRWMPVDQHNGDRRQETRNGLIQMAKAELQAHDAVGLLHPSVDEMLQLAKHASSLGDTDPARAIVMAVPTNNKPARPSLVAASSDNQDYLALFNDA